MGRPKGSGKKHTEVAQESVHGKNIAFATPDAVKAPEAPVLPTVQGGEICTSDTWKYHNDHEPRIFRVGEVIPEGWTEKSKVTTFWINTPDGRWKRG